MEQLFDKFYSEKPNPFKDATSCSSNIGFCQQYGSCEHLNHIQDTSTDGNDFESQIVNLCMKDYIAKNGALSCSNVCQPAHCCFTPESPCDGKLLENSICDKYSQCKVLYPEQLESPQATEETNQDLGTSLGNGSTDTSNDVSETHQGYQEDSIPSNPNIMGLSEMCNEKYIMAKGTEECKAFCKPYECK